MDFPAAAMVRFFRNHGLLGYNGQHAWYTVQGGSVSYVSRLEAAMRRAGVTIRLNAPIAGVRRSPRGVEVRAHGADWDLHDEVVFATHSDDTLAMLADPTPDETRLLGAIQAPAATLARLIQEPGARVARVIRSKPEAAAA